MVYCIVYSCVNGVWSGEVILGILGYNEERLRYGRGMACQERVSMFSRE